MGRLRVETLERVEKFADRTLDVVDALERQRRSRRILDQLSGCGTSTGANVWEADEAMSPKDFAKTLCVVIKELNETRYWLRLIARREWIPLKRLQPLEDEAVELKRMFGAMVHRTRKQPA
jgi:four helix bundle protein